MTHPTHIVCALAAAASLSSLTLGGPTETHFGLPHTPLGQVQLVAGPDGRLTVSNIGSSGKDGVSIDLGETDGWSIELDPGPAGLLPADSRDVLKTYFETGDVPTEQQFSNLIESVQGGQAGIGIDTLGFTPSCVRVELFLGGRVMDGADFTGTLPAHLVVGNIGSSGKDGVRATMGNHPNVVQFIGSLQWPVPDLVAIDGRLPVLADALAITFDGLPPGEPVVRTLEITGADAGAGIIHLHAEGIVHRDIAARASGGATMTGSCDAVTCNLTISNLGSSGKDGVSIAWDDPSEGEYDVPVRHATLDWDPIDLAAPGRRLDVSVPVALDGLPPGEPVINTLGLAESLVAGVMDVIVRYDDAMLADEAEIEVYDHGVFVGSALETLAVGTETTVGTLQSPVQLESRGLEADAEATPHGGGPRTLGVTHLFTQPVIFTPSSGGQPLVGNELRVLSRGGSVTVNGMLRIDLGGTNLGDLVIGGTSSEPAGGSTQPYFGLGHAALGTAQLSENASGHLTVSNIGSSGKDGVSIDLGEAQGWQGEIVLCEGCLPPNWSNVITVRGTDADTGAPVSWSAILDAAAGTGNPAVTLDLGQMCAPPTAARLVVLDRDGLVQHVFDYVPATTIPIIDALTVSGGLQGSLLVRAYQQARSTTGHECKLVLSSPGPFEIEVPGAPGSIPVQGRVVVTVDYADCAVTSSAVDSTWTEGIGGAAEVRREAIMQFGSAHAALGDARLEGVSCGGGAGGSLRISNIGSSGQDGVVVEISDDSSASLSEMLYDGVADCLSMSSMSMLDDGRLQNLSWRPAGTVNGIPASEVSTVDLGPPSGGARGVGVGPIRWMAPESITTKVFSQGIEVASAEGLAPGGVAMIFAVDIPDAYRFQQSIDTSAAGGGIPGNAVTGIQHVLVWDTLRDIGIPDGLPPHQGDELRIIARPQTPSTATVAIDALEVRAGSSAPTTLFLGRERVGFASDCPADFDRDGDVGFGDLLVLLGNWGQCDVCAPDLDGDGSVAFADLLLLLSVWGACP